MPDSEEIDRDAAESAWGKATVDGLVLLAAIGAANWFFSRDDPGFLSLNPTPWILLPLFLGGRYGIVAGLLGALAAAGALLGMKWKLEGILPREGITAEPYLYFSLLMSGAVAAFVRGLVAGPAERLRQRNANLEEQSAVLATDLALYRENELELQESLLLHGAEYTAYTAELHRLFTAETGRLEAGLLDLFDRLFGVSEAAIFRRRGKDTKAPMLRVAALGREEILPAELPDPEVAIAGRALESGELVTCRMLWTGDESEPAESNAAESFLAAIPWKRLPDRAPGALLLISRMDFERIDWETLARMEVIFHWVMAHTPVFSGDRPEDSQPVTELLDPEGFRNRLNLAIRAAKNLNLPSQLVIFSPAKGADSHRLHDFLGRLRLLVRPTDCLGAVHGNQPGQFGVGLLTPLLSEVAARAYVDRLLHQIGEGADVVQYEIIESAEIPSATQFSGEGQNREVEPEPDTLPSDGVAASV